MIKKTFYPKVLFATVTVLALAIIFSQITAGYVSDEGGSNFWHFISIFLIACGFIVVFVFGFPQSGEPITKENLCAGSPVCFIEKYSKEPDRNGDDEYLVELIDKRKYQLKTKTPDPAFVMEKKYYLDSEEIWRIYNE